MSEEDVESNGPLGFIAVHVGAGFHSPANSEIHKRLCRQACLQAVTLLRQRKPASEALRAAMISLENSPLTNAGFGSNLTVTGTVECDASIMDGHTLQYGAVGAVSGVKNPVLVAESLLKTQLKGTFSMGRIPPSTMVGPGAHSWAVSQGIPTLKDTDLITERSLKAYTKNKRKLDRIEGRLPRKARKVDGEDGPIREVNGADGTVDCESDDDEDADDQDRIYDTIGAICMDHTGNIFSAVSSGGIVLKQPGRIGQAAMYACGCWSENDDKTKTGIGISTSGTGEHLIKTLLAKTCADSIRSSSNPTTSLNEVFHDNFLESRLLSGISEKYGGVLALKADYSNPADYRVEVLWAHTTDSMCLAYMSAADDQLKALISRLPKEKIAGKCCVVQSESVNLTKTTYDEPGCPSNGEQPIIVETEGTIEV